LGFLRILLAMSVVLTHATPAFAPKLYPGNIAVEMFFIISGFYMSMIITEKYGASRNGILPFYVSRFFRLWPVFILTTLASYVWWIACYAYLGREPTTSGPMLDWIDNKLISALIHFSNLFMIGQDLPSIFHVSTRGLELTFGPPTGLPDGSVWLGSVRNIEQAWSIGTEIWFYLLAPLLVRTGSTFLIIVTGAALLLRLWMNWNGAATYFFFPDQLPLFIFGILAYRFGATAGFPFATRNGLAVALSVAIPIGGAVLFGSLVGVDERFKWILYVLFAATIPTLFGTTKDLKLDRVVGELSYPVYIVHMLLFAVVGTLGKHAGVTIGGEMVAVLAIAVSSLLYVFVDQPINKWRQRFAQADSSSRQQMKFSLRLGRQSSRALAASTNDER
jgi:peptidoglycan/LPS O-acetylase OafA/YrhL